MVLDPRSIWFAMELAKSVSTVHARADTGFLLMSIRGTPTDARLLNELNDLLVSKDALPEAPKILCDNRGFARVVTADFIGRALELGRTHEGRLAGGRVALVAGSAVQFGMQRMFSLRTEGLTFQVEAFRTVEQAREWLVCERPHPPRVVER